MPDATAMAGVDMRLEPGAYRELHWHVASEWSLVLNGSCRIQVCFPPFIDFRFADRQAVNENGETFIDDVSEGDVWFFPPYVTSHLHTFNEQYADWLGASLTPSKLSTQASSSFSSSTTEPSRRITPFSPQKSLHTNRYALAPLLELTIRSMHLSWS